MERLSHLIETLHMAGIWKAIPVSRGGTKISHLMFADDVVLFGEASADEALVVEACLAKFCAWSGQKINAQKSSIYFLPNTNEAVVVEICNTLGIPRTEDFGCYLEVPTINGKVTCATFQSVISRADKRLAGWKAKCLSLEVRIMLIQSTVMAIPAYLMQSARLPRSLCDELDRKIRRFLWGASNMQRKPHLVAWDVLTKEKENGGLGLRSLRQLNSACLMKLGWRFLSEPAALWARVLKDKYCHGRTVSTLEAPR